MQVATIEAPPAGAPDLDSYDRVILAFSGGKDSLACALHLLELGVPSEKIEFHHHEVDGREGPAFMDWESTPSYCRAVANVLGVRLFSSWKVGGFEREMLRDQQATAATSFETRNHGVITVGGTSGKLGTRLKFPQVSADLRCRWCSAYLKIDVLDKVLVNGPDYQGKRLLVVSGERAEESPSRARYKTFEPGRVHSVHKGRHVDHWRPVHGWSTAEVWEVIQRNGIVPHPAYFLGWGRLSCMTCVFASPSQWATIRSITPERFRRIAEYEARFGVTIQRKRSVVALADAGTSYAAALSQPDVVAAAMAVEWRGVVKVSPDCWILPAGAFGESAGPI